ncbi:protein CUSTOS [Brienomyrus brachyistius]|uniref:protein CUSTOS n=1 Tax=Brienomyrus brachyistius TaxID=42636 RepID=UPI0020B41C07|nr:protein CUSTOS [Brienomyrus brachyistius]
MAAFRDHVSSSSSSEDDKEIQRLKEAAWSFTEYSGSHDTIIPGGDCKDQPSRRINVSQHEHDGNELQTTPEFRTHVAKKLGSMLDSYISDGTSAEFQRTPRLDPEEEDDDDGFRLFSTSVPGEENLKPLALRRPVPSSSDSDSEMEIRLREAVVSALDFLPAPALPSMPQPSSSPPIPTENQSRTKKRKKKRKAKNGREAFVEESSVHVRMGIHVDREGEAQTHDHGRNTADTQGALKAALNSESTLLQDEIPVKKKKKKKKMRSEVEG